MEASIRGWHKSRRSSAQGANCVEIDRLVGGDVAIRQSKTPGVSLIYSLAEIQAFIMGVKDGEFDYLLSPRIES